MTWSLSASGHADNADVEAGMVEKLRTCMADVGAITALVSTQHGGQVDLLAQAPGEDAPQA